MVNREERRIIVDYCGGRYSLDIKIGHHEDTGSAEDAGMRGNFPGGGTFADVVYAIQSLTIKGGSYDNILVLNGETLQKMREGIPDADQCRKWVRERVTVFGRAVAQLNAASELLDEARALEERVE